MFTIDRFFQKPPCLLKIIKSSKFILFCSLKMLLVPANVSQNVVPGSSRHTGITFCIHVCVSQVSPTLGPGPNLQDFTLLSHFWDSEIPRES